MDTVNTKESGTIKPTAIVIPKDLTTTELHEALEKYVAKQRLEGKIIRTKPGAVVEILKQFFEING